MMLAGGLVPWMNGLRAGENNKIWYRYISIVVVWRAWDGNKIYFKTADRSGMEEKRKTTVIGDDAAGAIKFKIS